MKFYLLPVGEKFSYQGIDYTKSGPLTASSDVNGQNKMIPRSANIVVSKDIDVGKLEKSKDEFLPVAKVMDAVNVYHQQSNYCLGIIEDNVSKEIYDTAKSKLDYAYQQIFKSLNLK